MFNWLTVIVLFTVEIVCRKYLLSRTLILLRKLFITNFLLVKSFSFN